MASYFDLQTLSDFYIKYRPQYPKTLADSILHFANDGATGREVENMVEVCCGSGQSTFIFAPHAEKVLATDISTHQISQANKRKDKPDNVKFVAASAYEIPALDKSVDLITCAAGAHWLDIDKFFVECDRVLKENGTLAMYSYSFPRVVVLTNNDDGNRDQQALIDTLTEEYVNKIPRPKGRAVTDFTCIYADIYQKLTSNKKQKIENIMPVELSLRNWHGFLCSTTEYEVFHKNFNENKTDGEEDAMQEYMKKIKAVYDVEHLPDTDVKIRVDFQFFNVLSKGPFV